MDFLEGGGGSMLDQQESTNNALASVVGMVSQLLSFGFLSNLEKIQGISLPLCNLLDGTTDGLRVENGTNSLVPFSPPTERFKATSRSAAITSTKAIIIDVLSTICDVR